MTKTLALAIVASALSPYAFADGTATWLWDVTTQDGDAIVEPGELTGDLTTTDGVSLYNTNAGQLHTFDSFVTADNPVDVFAFEWAPDEPGAYDVGYTTVTDVGEPHTVYVIEWYGGLDADFIVYPVAEAEITFAVVPAPPTLLLFTIFTLPRRRSAPSAPPR